MKFGGSLAGLLSSRYRLGSEMSLPGSYSEWYSLYLKNFVWMLRLEAEKTFFRDVWALVTSLVELSSLATLLTWDYSRSRLRILVKFLARILL